ncbi:hypothetical protein Trco_001818 [Trichoderma cornu-damae]|uniref:Uncharacterized protein n=1 Tax=Trichoderma cornu-damae TaxID=654480 RepID=A0A9P8QTW9_9HYPO|nr:hypothetical protein Trco_001818 [Trichoderma cornu-damae]
MAPRTRQKPNTRARMQRAQTTFSELDLTPNRPSDTTSQGRRSVDQDGEALLPQDKVNIGLADDDEPGKLVSDEHEHQDGMTEVNTFAWSEAGSTNITRRSTPVNPSDIPIEELWDFGDESLSPFSSSTADNTALPDTMPLAHEHQADAQPLFPGRLVDFSETASTIRRSSPFGTSDACKDIWDFEYSASSSGASPDTVDGKGQTETPSAVKSSAPPHLHVDGLCDAAPRKSATPAQAVAQRKGNGSKAIGDAMTDSTDTVLRRKSNSTGQAPPEASAKSKKRRQRAKEPIKFHPLTQEIIAVPNAKKRSAPARLPIVSALQESAKGLVSPFVSAQKQPQKRPPRQKQQKPKRSRPAKKPKPEADMANRDPPPAGGADLVVISSSPSKATSRSPSACLQDLPNVDQHEKTRPDPPVSTNRVSDADQASGKRPHDPSLVADEFNHGDEPLPTEHAQFKRRRLSRQFSISEKGSPVVTRDDAPMKNTETAKASEPDPFLAGNMEQRAAPQPSSFLRTASNDKQVGQEYDGAFQDIDGKSSYRWLRRMGEQKPRQKRRSSMGQKLHDEIMKSFLGATEAAAGSQAPKKPEGAADAGNFSQVNKQVRLIADTAAAKVAEAYHASGADSVAHLRRQCLQDRDNLAETLRKDETLFGRHLRVAKEAIKASSRAREKSAMELDEAMKARHEVYSRVRLSLGAIRGQLVSGK